MPRMLLVRHAQSVWNVEGLWQGHADPPLSELGEDQAKTAAGGFGPVDMVVSSDLQRARRTAELLVPGADYAVDPELREYDVGAWSGRTRSEIESEWPAQLAVFDSGHLDAPPGGERRADFERRVLRAVSRWVERCAVEGAERTLVVTHGGVIRTLARLHGWQETRVTHLCGYDAETHPGDKGGTVALLHTIDLLNGVVTGPRPDGEVAY